MTIYALSTGPGVSGIAIIRISGNETTNVIKLLTKKNLPAYIDELKVQRKNYKKK